MLSSLPRRNNSPFAKCGCKKHYMDFHGDHTATYTAHSGATKAHDWMVGVLGPLFRTAGHTVRTQHGVTASAGQRRGDVELRSYLQDTAGRQSLVFDLSMTHDRFGSSSHVQFAIPRTSMRICVLLRSAKLTAVGNNQNISFLPAIVSTSTRMCTQGCGGCGICEHGKRRSRCKQGCGGGGICEHGKERSRCTQGCGGGSICAGRRGTPSVQGGTPLEYHRQAASDTRNLRPCTLSTNLYIVNPEPESLKPKGYARLR